VKAPQSIAAATEPLLSEARSSGDSPIVAKRYEQACRLARSHASNDISVEESSRCETFACWLDMRKEERLTEFAVEARNFTEAERLHQRQEAALEKLRRSLLGMAQSERELLGAEEADWYLAYRDESHADYLLSLVDAGGAAAQEVAATVRQHAVSAAGKYKALGHLDDVASCYLTLAQLSEALNDPDGAYRAACTSADLFHQALEQQNLDEEDTDILRVVESGTRATSTFQYGLTRMMRGRYTEARDLFKATAAFNRELSERYAKQGEKEESEAALIDAELADALELYADALQDSAPSGTTTVVSTKLAEAKGRLASLDEVRAGKSFQTARSLVLGIELDMNSFEMLSLLRLGDWNAAEAAYDRVTHTIEELRLVDESANVLDLISGLVRGLRELTLGERFLQHYEFASAEERFAEGARVVGDAGRPRENAKKLQLTLLAPKFSLANGLSQYCLGRQVYSEALHSAFVGESDEAVRQMDKALSHYRDARTLLSDSDEGGSFVRALCANATEESEGFKRFLLAKQLGEVPRVRLSIQAQERCNSQGHAKLAITLQNGGKSAARDTKCKVLLPDSFDVRGSGGLANRDGGWYWEGELASGEIREFPLSTRAPSIPGVYEVEAECIYGDGLERSFIQIEVVAPVIERNLGFVTLRLTETTVAWLRIAGYPLTLVIGGVIAVVLSHVIH